MDSRAGRDLPGSAAAMLIAESAASESRGSSDFIMVCCVQGDRIVWLMCSDVVKAGQFVISRWRGLDECRGLVERNPRDEPRHPGLAQILGFTSGGNAWRQRASFVQHCPRYIFFAELPMRHRQYGISFGLCELERTVRSFLPPHNCVGK